MHRQDIDYKKVALAAEAIKKRGKEPSLTDLCAELGLMDVTPELPALLEQWYHTQPAFKRGSKAPLTENIKVRTNDQAIEKNLELEKSLSLLRATLESTADGIMMVNGQGQVVDWNQKFVEMWRIPSHMLESGTESIGFDYILEQVADPKVLIADVQYLYQNPKWQGELPELHFKDGRIFERYTQPQQVGSEIVGRVYSFRDITKKRVIDDQLRIRERAIEASTHGVAIIDISKQENKIIYVNKAFERITGYSEKQALGQNLSTLQGNAADVGNKRLLLAIKELREEMVDLKSMRRNGDIYWCETSVAPVRDSFEHVKHYVCILNDITQRCDMEKQLLMQATHDSLTALPNRVLLIDRVDQAILQAKKNQTQFAFLFLDLDRFKMTNDTLGHYIGDKLLQAIANRLLIATNDFDTVARLGGDEFVILLPELTNTKHAEKIAQEILHLIERPIQIDNHSIKITASLGISFYPQDGINYEALMKSADLSMYHAKDNGRNNYRVFEPEMNSRFISHVQIDSALQDALKNNELYMVYQPIIDLKTNTVVGVEALMRWQNPVLGLVSPADFIPLAEENGMIIAMGEWALEESCRQTVIWHKNGFTDLTLAVNISGRQLRQSCLPDVVNNVLKLTGLPAKYLELELTESILIEDIERVVDTMYVLKDMGLKLVIDDFGTGYSSLSYLKQFPVDKLKIDRSFIYEMTSNKNDAAIAKAIINLSHSLNLQVVAEGVETEFQNNFIIEHGCEYAQGYYFRYPETPDKLTLFLQKYPDMESK